MVNNQNQRRRNNNAQQPRNRRTQNRRNTRNGSQPMNSAVPRMAPVQRNYDILIPPTWLFTQATQSDESQLGIGSYFVSKGLAFSLADFLDTTSGIKTVFDQYKFDLIEVFGYLDNYTQSSNPVLVTASVDYDDTVDPTWDTMSQRNNTKTVYITNLEPMKLLARFKPRGNYITSLGDSPTNIIPNPNAYWDMAQPRQGFNGIKICAASQSSTSLRILVKAKISLRGKI